MAFISYGTFNVKCYKFGSFQCSFGDVSYAGKGNPFNYFVEDKNQKTRFKTLDDNVLCQGLKHTLSFLVLK